MDLPNQYIKLDESNYNQDYVIFKILDTNSNDVYKIYYLKKNDNYFFHDNEDKIILSHQTLLHKFNSLNEILNYWFLFLIVFIGGQIGNFLNLKIFPARILALVTAGLVIFVAARMGFNLLI